MFPGDPLRPLPDPSADALDELERGVEKVIAAEAPLELARLRRLADRLEAAWVRQVRVAERAGLLDSPGRSAAGVLAEAARVPFGAARRALVTGQRLEVLEATAAAALAGELRPDHVRVLADACTPARAEAFVALEDELVAVGRRCSARALSMVVARVCDAIDGDAGAGAANERFEQRRVHLSRTLGGVGALDGILDQEGTEVVLTALEHRMAGDPDQAGDRRRTRPQRRADALVDICRRYLTTNDERVARRRGRPQVGVIVDLALLEERMRGVAPDVRGEPAHTGALSKATLLRLTCDAGVHRVLTAGRSEVLDVGRATRTVPDALWRALVARDGHCQAPGCEQPAGWCEAHHLRHWSAGGPTTLANLQLLCWRHHRAAHEGRVQCEGRVGPGQRGPPG